MEEIKEILKYFRKERVVRYAIGQIPLFIVVLIESILTIFFNISISKDTIVSQTLFDDLIIFSRLIIFEGSFLKSGGKNLGELYYLHLSMLINSDYLIHKTILLWIMYSVYFFSLLYQFYRRRLDKEVSISLKLVVNVSAAILFLLIIPSIQSIYSLDLYNSISLLFLNEPLGGSPYHYYQRFMNNLWFKNSYNLIKYTNILLVLSIPTAYLLYKLGRVFFGFNPKRREPQLVTCPYCFAGIYLMFLAGVFLFYNYILFDKIHLENIYLLSTFEGYFYQFILSLLLTFTVIYLTSGALAFSYTSYLIGDEVKFKLGGGQIFQVIVVTLKYSLKNWISKYYLSMAIMALLGFTGGSVLLNLFFTEKIATQTNAPIHVLILQYISFVFLSFFIWSAVLVTYLGTRGKYARYSTSILRANHFTDLLLVLLLGSIKLILLAFFILGGPFFNLSTALGSYLWVIIAQLVLDLGIATPIYKMVLTAFEDKADSNRYIKALAIENILQRRSYLTVLGGGSVGRSILRDIIETIYYYPNVKRKFDEGEFLIDTIYREIKFIRIMNSQESPTPIIYLVSGITVMERDEKLVSYTDRDPRIGRFGIFEITFTGELSKYKFYFPAVVEDIRTRYALRKLTERSRLISYTADKMKPVIDMMKDLSQIITKEALSKTEKNRLSIFNVLRGPLYETIVNMNHNSFIEQMKAIYKRHTKHVSLYRVKDKEFLNKFKHELLTVHYLPIYFEREIGALAGKLMKFNKIEESSLNGFDYKYLILGAGSRIFYAIEELLSNNPSMVYTPQDGYTEYFARYYYYNDKKNNNSAKHRINIAKGLVITDTLPTGSIPIDVVLQNKILKHTLSQRIGEISHIARAKWMEVGIEDIYHPILIDAPHYSLLHKVLLRGELEAILITYKNIVNNINAVSLLARTLLDVKKENPAFKLPTVVVLTHSIAETNKIESLLRSVEKTVRTRYVDKNSNAHQTFFFFVIPYELYQSAKFNSIYHSVTSSTTGNSKSFNKLFVHNKILQDSLNAIVPPSHNNHVSTNSSSSSSNRRLSNSYPTCRRHCYYANEMIYLHEITSKFFERTSHGFNFNYIVNPNYLRAGQSIVYTSNLFSLPVKREILAKKDYLLTTNFLLDRGLLFTGCIKNNSQSFVAAVGDIVSANIGKSSSEVIVAREDDYEHIGNTFVIACLSDIPGALYLFLRRLLLPSSSSFSSIKTKVNLTELLAFPCNSKIIKSSKSEDSISKKTQFSISRYMFRAVGNISDTLYIISDSTPIHLFLNSMLLFMKKPLDDNNELLNCVIQKLLKNDASRYFKTNLLDEQNKLIEYIVSDDLIKAKKQEFYAETCNEELCPIFRLRYSIQKKIESGEVFRTIDTSNLQCDDYLFRLEYISSTSSCRGILNCSTDFKKPDAYAALVYLVLSIKRKK